MSDLDLVPTEVEPVVRKRRRVLPVFNFLLILALGGGVLFLWLQVWPQMVLKQDLIEVQTAIEDLENLVDGLSDRQIELPVELMEDISKDLATQSEKNAQAIEAQQELVEELSVHLEGLAVDIENALSLSASSEKDRIARSNNEHLMFMLRLARNQLNLWKDPKSALRSLEQVDSLLAESDTLVYEATREEVLAHIQRLKEIVAMDTTGVLLRLNVLVENVDEISFNVAMTLVEEEATELEADLPSAESTEESTIWRTLVDGAVGLVKVTSHEQLEVQPLLTAEEQRLVRLRLSLNLERASHAVLRSDQALYTSSLETAVELINRYLKLEDPTVATFLTEIEALRNFRVEVDLPDLDRTIQKFQLASDSQFPTKVPKPNVERPAHNTGASSN